jgi:aryl-alcohol dehydrogenase-like predicted oxidoreductase
LTTRVSAGLFAAAEGGENVRRRTFFGGAFSGLVAASTPGIVRARPGDLPKRRLGRTGVDLTIIGMGGARFHLIPFDEGVALVRRAYELGINYFDMARSYWDGKAEEVYGAAIGPFRKEIFLTSKSGQRSAAEATRELETSLRLMKTDHVDLWQIHGVNTEDDVRKVLAPGGVLEAFVAAKKAGKCRFIGYTGHADPAFNVALLKSYDGFDTTLMPLHASDTAYLSFEKTALPVAVERGLGIFGMKIFGNAFLLRTFSVMDCLRYTLSLPITAAVLGFTTPGQLEDDVRIAQQFKTLPKEEMERIRARAALDRFDVAKGPALEYWKRKL